MPHVDFVHLRVHSPYSLSEGAVRIKDMVKLCRGLDMPAIAITDTDNLFGALEFSKTLAGEGVQPIIGCQLTLKAGGEPRQNARQQLRPPSLVVLAKSEEGYRNILKMLRIAYLDSGEAEEPHVTLDQVCEHNAGLILLTGGAEGPVGQLLAAGRKEDANALFMRLCNAFSGRIYVEIQRHGTEAEQATEGGFLELAYAHDIPLVATNEAFFPTRGMYEAHDVLVCIAEGAYLAQAQRRRLTPEHYLKSPAEMRTLFADLPEAIDNTLVIARRCAYMVASIAPILPPYDCGEGMDEETTVRRRAEQGLERRLETIVLKPEMTDGERAEVRTRYSERLQYELGVIVQMGFAGYFLIVSDFISWAKAHGIPVGPGRGSGAGSLVAWSLTITDLDPIRWGLLFERFLNPERVSMPDFDIDFCQERRDEVIAYVQHKYGRDKVAQIITFGKLQARAVLRDVGRVLGMPYSQVDRICKLVPNNPAKPVTLEQAIDSEPQLRAMIADDEAVGRLVELAKPLEGLYRHASTHAAGVVIGDRPLEELVPLYRDPKNPMPVSGFNMKYVESAGLVKFDFLGLKTLTVIAKALQYIKEPLDLSAMPLDDRATYEMLGRGETTGVFQLESAGMRDVLRKLKPDTFEDIIAVVALYRPGPMDNIPSYIKRKHGEEEPDYLYPSLEWILKETFGIIIYQEQVMQIAQELSGYTLGGADLLRRAMGKKIKEEMDKQRQIFVDGAVGRKVAKDKASEIFDLVAKFAGYGFNKSHAAAYALVAYQTAYLKANYAAEFMAALMTLDMGNTDKLAVYRQDLDRLGIPLLPPDLNASEAEFVVEARPGGGKAIRYALAAVKNVGAAAMAGLVRERKDKGRFKSLTDLARRLDVHQVGKRPLENLVRAGAFDGLNANRHQIFEGLERLVRMAAAAAEDRASNQIGLFAATGEQDELTLPRTSDWSPMERLKEEFDAIGFYLSSHPLQTYGKTLARLRVRSFADVLHAGQSGLCTLAGTVIGKRERTTSKGSRYAFVQFSDASGVFEATVFSEVLAASRDLIEVGRSLLVRASVQIEGEEGARLTVHSLEDLDAVAAQTAAGLQVFIDSEDSVPVLSETLKKGNRGRGKVVVIAKLDPATEVPVSLPGGYAITRTMMEELRKTPGIVEVREI